MDVCMYGRSHSVPMPRVKAHRIPHPMKLRRSQNRSNLWPFIIARLRSMASFAVRSGFSSRMNGVIA